MEICSSEKQMSEKWLCNLILPLTETLSNPIITSKKSKILNQHYGWNIKCYHACCVIKSKADKLIYLSFYFCFFEVVKNSTGKLSSISQIEKQEDFFLLLSKSVYDISLHGVLLMSQPYFKHLPNYNLNGSCAIR